MAISTALAHKKFKVSLLLIYGILGRHLSIHVMHDPIIIRWTLIRRAHLKLDFDGSAIMRSGRAGVQGLIRG